MREEVLKADACMDNTLYLSGRKGHINTVSLSRIEGFDVVRAFAVFAMVFVNCYVLLPSLDAYPRWYNDLFNFLFGRSAVLFVMLAGVGLSLMAKAAYLSADRGELMRVRKMLLKRSLILLGLGFLFMNIWSADILHFYGLFLIAGAFLVNATNRHLWVLATLCIAVSALIICVDGINLKTISSSPVMLAGVIDDFLFDGYYPLFPWAGFLIIGIWFGRLSIMSDRAMKRRVLVWALIIFAAAELISRHLPEFLLHAIEVNELDVIDMLLISEVFPVTPLFSVSASAGSLALIIVVMAVVNSRPVAKAAGLIAGSGKMTLTIYITHIFVILGVKKVASLLGNDDLNYAINLAMPVLFCLTILIFSNLWFKHFSHGPLEWVLRRYSR